MVDLPTIIESHKTFYKTADICQLLICKEGEDLDDGEYFNSPEIEKEVGIGVLIKAYENSLRIFS